MTRLDDGALLIAAPEHQFVRFGGKRTLRVLRSDDGGRSWRDVASLGGFKTPARCLESHCRG